MSSITLHVTHNNVTKKIATEKSATVSQLISTALTKFGINESSNASLISKSNNKKLDVVLPIRLTNLINNSKLTLEVSEQVQAKSKQVSLKCIINKIDKSNSNTILKVNNDISIKQLLLEISSKDSSIDLTNNYDKSQMDIIINILDNKISINEQSNELNNRLSSIIGEVSNLVIRISFIQLNNNEKLLEQEKINELQLEQQRQTNKKAEEDRLNNIENQRLNNEEEAKLHLQKQKQKLSEQNGNEAAYEKKEVAYKEDEMEVDEKPKSEEKNAKTNSIDSNSSPKKLDSTKLHNNAQFTPTQEKSPQLYKSSSSSSSRQIYENPDEDYEVSVSQIQKYHKLISNTANSNQSKNNKKVVPIPESYTIRIKFPNQSILQLYFENGLTIKLGQLIKKIDELLLPTYINQYNLKFGYPPFTKIEPNFKNNSTKLNDYLDFAKTDKITLIWECGNIDNSFGKGPYLKESDSSLSIKNSDELPEMILESNRSELDDDEEVDGKGKNVYNNNSSTGSSNEVKKDSKGNKLPKWFKLK